MHLANHARITEECFGAAATRAPSVARGFGKWPGTPPTDPSAVKAVKLQAEASEGLSSGRLDRPGKGASWSSPLEPPPNVREPPSMDLARRSSPTEEPVQPQAFVPRAIPHQMPPRLGLRRGSTGIVLFACGSLRSSYL